MSFMRFLVLMLLPFLLVSCKLPLPEGYPEHPGEAGKETLEGIDSDGDGVRDDIKIEIFYAYPDDPVARAALEQEAKAFHSALLAGAIQDESAREKASLEARYEIAKSIKCVFNSVFTGDEEARYKLLRFMEREFINTSERSSAYIHYNQALSGKTLSSIKVIQPCEFNTQTGELLSD